MGRFCAGVSLSAKCTANLQSGVFLYEPAVVTDLGNNGNGHRFGVNFVSLRSLIFLGPIFLRRASWSLTQRLQLKNGAGAFDMKKCFPPILVVVE